MRVADSPGTTPEATPTDSPEPGLPKRELQDVQLQNVQLQIIHAELERTLASHHFHNSKRCQSFLRYVIREILSGRRDLKERSIGVEVFERSPSYDTNQDPVVRMTAGEVRKRLALYYQDPAHHPDLRIELPLGSYAPVLRWSQPVSAQPLLAPQLLAPVLLAAAAPIEPPVAAAPAAQTGPSEQVEQRASSRVARPSLALASSIAAIVLLVIAGLLGWRMHVRSPSPSALHEFWQPILAAPDPVLVSIGQIRPKMAEVEPNVARSSVKKAIALQGAQGYPHEIAVCVLNDALAMTEISSLLQSAGKKVTVRPESTTSLNDLQAGPFVLIGAFNNDWSIRYSDPLRFHFRVDDTDGSEWIADREHPETRLGVLGPLINVTAMRSDYAIAARFYDQRTKQMVVIAAGLTPYGTRAAGDFLTDPGSIAELESRAPAGWSKKNMEVLLRTDLVDNESGPPVLLDSTFW